MSSYKSHIFSVPCSRGTYLDKTDALHPKCRDCPVGTYKENQEDLLCSPCPPGTSTIDIGSTNVTGCIGSSVWLKKFLIL